MPRSLYKKTRWEGTPNPNPLLVTSKGSVQTSTQVADFVLCSECEQRFSERGEKYTMSVVDHNGVFPLLNRLNAIPPTRDRGFGKLYNSTATPDIDRKQLAYFALSIFWRASVHRWKSPGETSQQIRLGPYQEALRRFLHDEASFPPDIVLMTVVCTDEATRNSFFSPTRSKKGPSTTHTFNARGIMFFLEAGRHMDPQIKPFCMVSGKSQWIWSRTCQDKMQIAMGELLKQQALRSRMTTDR